LTGLLSFPHDVKYQKERENIFSKINFLNILKSKINRNSFLCAPWPIKICKLLDIPVIQLDVLSFKFASDAKSIS